MKKIRKILLFFTLMFICYSFASAQEQERIFNKSFETASNQIIQNLSKYYNKSFKPVRDKKHIYFSMNWKTVYDKNKNEQKERFKINIYKADEETTNVKLDYQVEYTIKVDNKKTKIKLENELLNDYYNDIWKILETEDTNNIQEVKYRDFDIKEYIQKQELEYKKRKERTYNIEYNKVYSKMLANMAKTFKSIQFADRESGVILTNFLYPGDFIQQFIIKRRFKINLLISKINENETSVSAEILTQMEGTNRFDYDYYDIKIKKDKDMYDTLFKILEDGFL